MFLLIVGIDFLLFFIYSVKPSRSIFIVPLLALPNTHRFCILPDHVVPSPGTNGCLAVR